MSRTHSSSVPSPSVEILLEDGPVLAINKPAGQLTHGLTHGDPPALDAQLKAWLKEKYHKPGNVYLGVVHRLDRPVSGAMVFARNSKAAARLSEQFRERDVRKIYWAIVEGVPDPPEGACFDWILKDEERVSGSIVPANTRDARPCELSYRTLASSRGMTWLEVEPATGRSHQIRVQLASRGWPIAGDVRYGAKTKLDAAPAGKQLFAPIALHARSLSFQHPIRYEPLVVTAPIPQNWLRRYGERFAALRDAQT